jgi:hypothetical protein
MIAVVEGVYREREYSQLRPNPQNPQEKRGLIPGAALGES